MDINFSAIEIHRGVMHHLDAKTKDTEHATATFEKTLFDIDDQIRKVLIDRLTYAAGRDSKAFELEIGNYSKNSFFDYVKDIKTLNDKKFFETSKKITSRLSECQNRNNIPGGVVILLDCSLSKKNTARLYIVIKAELHEALRHQKRGGRSKLQVLTEIFLSPAQRLYKVGIVYERKDGQNQYPNDVYGCFLYDEQFRADGSKPAGYFYDRFLGFSVDKNAKIQIKRFYDNTYGFILKNIPEIDEKESLINALSTELTTNLEETISPVEFGKKYFIDEDINDAYTDSVLNYLPSTISKDTTLIKGDLSKKKIRFPNTITLSGTIEEFDKNVKIIRTEQDFKELDYKNPNYTILRIQGKPFEDA